MSDLATFQQLFLDDIYQGGGASTTWLKPTGGNISPHQSLTVYHHSTVGILEDALLAVFPVLTLLVGEPFMQAMVREFIKEHPLHVGDLNAYGAGLAGFIRHFPPAGGLPYLADVACLEWSMHHAVFAPDAPRLNPERLAALSEEDAPRITLVPHPSLSFVSSPYPIERIWLANQPNSISNEAINLDEGGIQLAIWRPELDVVRWEMAAPAFILLQSLAGGSPFAPAMQCASQHADATPESLQAGLAAMLRHGLFTDIHLNPQGTTDHEM